MTDKAIEHLETAEAALMTFLARISDEPEDEEILLLPPLIAVLRSISRAIGVLEAK